MSERDLKRIEVLSEVRTGRRTVAAAAPVLAVSERQAYRLLARYEVDGMSEVTKNLHTRPQNEECSSGQPDLDILIRTDNGLLICGQCLSSTSLY